MAGDLHLDPEFAAVVAEMRERGRANGYFDIPNQGPWESGLTPEDREAVACWVGDGGYRAAAEAAAASDLDIAAQ